MLSVTKLLCRQETPGDSLRYSESAHRRPVIVWNLTKRCNLNCLHCYASAGKEAEGELSAAEATRVIDDLASYGVPVVLFSGGEPLLKEDILKLLAYARGKGLRTVLSTNGTLISAKLAKELKDVGVSYVGVSLDGVREVNDLFRGKKGAFEQALRGLRYCLQEDIRTGIRFTITRFNAPSIPDIFKVVEEENIPRLCFYHLVYAGRGSGLVSWDLSLQETREVVDMIFRMTEDFHRRRLFKEVLTVDNHADGVYLYLKLLNSNPSHAQEVYHFLKLSGGNSSGIGLGAIDEQGWVHPDQFWRHYSLGNVREKSFAKIWEDSSQPLLSGLRRRESLLKGRCWRCQYLELCRGNFRVRAEAFYGDIWAPDPACYLTDREIGIG